MRDERPVRAHRRTREKLGSGRVDGALETDGFHRRNTQLLTRGREPPFRRCLVPMEGHGVMYGAPRTTCMVSPEQWHVPRTMAMELSMVSPEPVRQKGDLGRIAMRLIELKHASRYRGSIRGTDLVSVLECAGRDRVLEPFKEIIEAAHADWERVMSV